MVKDNVYNELRRLTVAFLRRHPGQQGQLQISREDEGRLMALDSIPELSWSQAYYRSMVENGDLRRRFRFVNGFPVLWGAELTRVVLVDRSG